MIRIVYHRDFLKSAAQLPAPKLQRKLTAFFMLLHDNPFRPLLHTVRLTGELAGFFSFRITRDWRVIFQFLAADTIPLLRVTHRKDTHR